MKHTYTALCALVFFALPAQAAPSYKGALSSARGVHKSEVKLRKTIASLSAADREKLKKALASVGSDSDSDGVSDLFEQVRGSNLCSADSDSDGVDDSQDGYENDDNRTGFTETRGTVTSFADPTLVVNGKSFTITDSTRFRKGLSSKSDLTVGTCVKVEGYVDASSLNIATKVEKEKDCGDSDD